LGGRKGAKTGHRDYPGLMTIRFSKTLKKRKGVRRQIFTAWTST